jgi:hypothetical protein
LKAFNGRNLEKWFILVFGAFHFAVPFLFPPSSNAITILGFLRIADFVLPGAFLLAILSFVFYFTKNRYSAGLLAFLYGGGVVFHVLYLSGLFPSVLTIPSNIVPVLGAIVDALAILTVYDYYRRVHLAN